MTDNEQGPPERETRACKGNRPLYLQGALLSAPVPLTVLIVRVRADPVRKAQIIGLGQTLVATTHFSQLTCCFRRFLRRSFTGLFRNENAKFTESLLSSRFAI